ncbi:MAG: hypothetical protein M1831_000137 [Alyxoria varia]|nr:MAG: hypothetical protein M1831_000137 [Alyxoria varia]
MSMKVSSMLNPQDEGPISPAEADPISKRAPDLSSPRQPPEQIPNNQSDERTKLNNDFEAANALAALAAGHLVQSQTHHSADSHRPPPVDTGRYDIRAWDFPFTFADDTLSEHIESVLRQTPDQISPLAVISDHLPSANPAEVPTIKTETAAEDEEPSNLPAIDGALDRPMDEETLTAIKTAQNEYGTRKKPHKDYTIPPPLKLTPSRESPPHEKPAATGAKKRPAPKRPAVTKKSTEEVKKPPPKKRKTSIAKDNSNKASQNRSETPASASGRGSKTPALAHVRKTSKSATPIRSSPLAAPPADEEEESTADSVEDTDVVYCICRKPDNHTWMIGCDGGCEDWFHGKCVNINQEDEDLIDKYICPNCEENDKGPTTWKPMCRRDGCRRPARIKKGSESKYCSDTCGEEFMKGALSRTGGLRASPTHGGGTTSKKGESTDSDTDIGPLGGPIRPQEVKALAISAPDIEHFRRLGSAGVLTPPPTASPDIERKLTDHDYMSKAGEGELNAHFSGQEQVRLEQIAAHKMALRKRRALLKDREQFVVMAKERAAKTKELCGYDSMLSWDDVAFEKWRNSEEGMSAFKKGMLGAEVVMNGSTDENGICGKKRCNRHNSWQKLALQDVRFEEADVGDDMRKVDREEKDLRQAAIQREKSKGQSDLMAKLEGEEGGVVEVVA